MKTILEQIKDAYEYPIGIKDKDKFCFESAFRSNGKCKSNVILLQPHPPLIIDITEELYISISQENRMMIWEKNYTTR